jgi:hypothetical protein
MRAATILLVSGLAAICGVPKNTKIRKVNLRTFLAQTFADGDCEGTSRAKVFIEYKKYADVDNDGVEEVIIVGSSCYSGTGGPDIFSVYKAGPDGKLIDISPSMMIREFKGKAIFPKEGNWIVSLDFKNGHLIRTHSDSHCGNGSISLYFKWKNDQFELVRVVKSPE